MNTLTTDAYRKLIVDTIHAVKDDTLPRTAEMWVRFCVKAADEAAAAVMENPPAIEPGSVAEFLRRIDGDEQAPNKLGGKLLTQAANQAAADAYRACMPQLVGRRAAQAYIACIAVGMQLRYIAAAEGRSLLYTAQLALSAARASRAK